MMEVNAGNEVKSGKLYCRRGRSPLLDHNFLPSSPIQSTTTGSTCHAIFPSPSVLIIGPGRPRFRYPLSCLPTSIFPSKRDVPSLSVLRTKRPPTMRIPSRSFYLCPACGKGSPVVSSARRIINLCPAARLMTPCSDKVTCSFEYGGALGPPACLI